jgi:hypothetical protein
MAERQGFETGYSLQSIVALEIMRNTLRQRVLSYFKYTQVSASRSKSEQVDG